jgi:hypothetical protein
MPFRARARITIENQSGKDVGVVAYKILYHQVEVPADWAYFHAQWRRSVTTRGRPEHVILDGVRGEGLYVGTYLAWSAFSRGWWGEGEVKFFIDGDGEFPTLSDTGTEDYFGGAWCFYQTPNREQAYSTGFLGMPLARIDDAAGPRLFSLYRWHLYDAIGFASDLKVSVQALGWHPDGTYEPLTDDIASVAFWYQRRPHAPFPALPPLRERWGR